MNDCSTALGWTLEGPRARGRPKTSWRKTVRRERGKVGWRSWAKVVAGNRGVWADNVTALCAYLHNER